MANPYTIQFGPWLPDLENVAVEIPYQFGAVPVPCVDCENVYYQDGAYRSLPGPASIGPALGAQALNAFTWYDNTGAQEIVFAATASGLSALIAGSWEAVPVYNAITVSVTGVSLRLGLSSSPAPNPLSIALSTGTVTTTGQIYHGTMVAGSEEPNAGIIGFIDGLTGSITPSKIVYGNPIDACAAENPGTGWVLIFTLGTGNLSKSFFTSLQIPTLSLQYESANATFSTNSSSSMWSWPLSSAIFVSGKSYTIDLS